ncbi:MAG: lysine--tRNA ligase [Candidatus Omnitrophica bacterium]|nr:lysine--tRNA ligase [Candidatus Omnitrophota bacterium]
MELNEIIQQRKAKSAALEAKGVTLYPSQVPAHLDICQVLSDFQEGKKVSLCGRIMAKRSHGKATFMDIRDSTGKIQLYLKEDFIGKENFSLLENLDIADIISAQGELFKTHTQEPSLKVEECLLLAKALRPLPEKWHGLKDIDLRYRQRYLDLVSNEEVRKVFLLRARAIKAIRNFLDERGFLEVETPMMHYIPGGAAGRPFKTHHNEYDLDLYLRIAPELYLKRLLVGGLGRVYEINRSFRNEGVSTRHNPEFTMLEAYCAYANYEEMMRLAEELIVFVSREVLGEVSFDYQAKRVDLTQPWKRISFAGLVKEKFDISPADEAEVMLEKLKAKGFAKDAARLSRSQISKLMEDILAEGLSANPTFVTDYFTNLCPLAKARKNNSLISERFELYIGGIEVGNAYTELNDPLEQKKRFEEELRELNKDEKKTLDEDYVLALEHGLPPAGGLGIGIDRLIMLLANQASIRDVILFPLLRPEKTV